jgi:hypothetical protein
VNRIQAWKGRIVAAVRFVIENIRKIGIFMVAAQAVMYFAPGRQYDKYIKLIAGVMILMQFVSPFVNHSDQIEQEWQQGMEQMMQKLEGQDADMAGQEQWGNAGTQEAIVDELEETIAARLDQVNENTAYRVCQVTLQLKNNADETKSSAEDIWEAESISVVMEKAGREDGSAGMTPIVIEDIVVSSEQNEPQTEEAENYRKLFADTLGMEEGKVEVTCRGGW